MAAKNILKTILIKHGVTQIQLQIQSKLSYTTINLAFNNKKNPGLKRQERIVEAINILSKTKYIVKDVFL